jgi:hypothetical protein
MWSLGRAHARVGKLKKIQSKVPPSAATASPRGADVALARRNFLICIMGFELQVRV